MLDAHSLIASPAETGFAGALAKNVNVWHVLASSNQGVIVNEPPASVLSEIRRTGKAMMDFYCSAERKRHFCDKSLDTVDYIPLIRSLFPDARFIVLYRHAMDVIASGVEASPWGFDSFGFGPFVQANPWNFVAALGQYWLSFTDRAIAVERQHAEACMRVRYEDLVEQPEDVLQEVLQFLSIEWEPNLVQNTFLRAKAVGLPGDYKLRYTNRVLTNSVGRGKSVPVAMLPETLLGAMNRALVELGYTELDAQWNVNVDDESPDETVETADIDISRLLDTHVASALARDQDAIRDRWGLSPSTELTLKIDGQGRWNVGFGTGTVTPADIDASLIAAADAKTWRQLACGAVTGGALVKSGAIRIYESDESNSQLGWQVIGALSDLLGAAAESQAKALVEGAEERRIPSAFQGEPSSGELRTASARA
jgi:post-segregation antitoxin (ccd killing protein)